MAEDPGAEFHGLGLPFLRGYYPTQHITSIPSCLHAHLSSFLAEPGGAGHTAPQGRPRRMDNAKRSPHVLFYH